MDVIVNLTGLSVPKKNRFYHLNDWEHFGIYMIFNPGVRKIFHRVNLVGTGKKKSQYKLTHFK